MSERKPKNDPSITIPLAGGSISITAAGPAAMIRAFTEGREQVVLRATLAQLTELIDGLIARRSKMKRDRDRRLARADAIDVEDGLPLRPRPIDAAALEPEDEPPAPPVERKPAAPPLPARTPTPRVPDVAPSMAIDPPARRSFKKLSPEALDKLRELHRAGWYDEAIGKAIGVSSVAVGKRRKAMGLASNYQRRPEAAP